MVAGFVEITEKEGNCWLRGVDLNHRPLGYESRGKLQIQILCGADDNPREPINTDDLRCRDP